MARLVVKKGPAHPLAVVSLVVALVAVGLALYGSFLSEGHITGSPLNAAREGAGLEFAQRSKLNRYTLQLVAYFLPFGLGVGAALLGGEAMRAIERHGEKYSGHFSAVFGIMVGGLAAVISGCMILAVYVWTYVPAAYTT